jgi:hypothetical protein
MPFAFPPTTLSVLTDAPSFGGSDFWDLFVLLAEILVLVILAAMAALGWFLVILAYRRLRATKTARPAISAPPTPPPISSPPARPPPVAFSASASPALPATAASVKPAVAPGVEPGVLAAIAAVVHVLMDGRPHRIVSLQPAGETWAREGRREIFESHHVR